MREITFEQSDDARVMSPRVTPIRTARSVVTSKPSLNAQALNTLFRNARTHYAWQEREVEDALLNQIYELAKWAPTAMNSSPLRVIFVKSQKAKERLLTGVAPMNLEKVRMSGATAILAYDPQFWQKLDTLVPYRDAKPLFANDPEKAEKVAMTNAHLQAGYFIMAARGLGLDVGPVGGFQAPIVDNEFLSEQGWKSFLLLNLGHGDPTKLMPRAPRLEHSEATKIV